MQTVKRSEMSIVEVDFMEVGKKNRAFETALIQRAIDQDQTAWNIIVSYWAPIVLKWCTYMGGPGIDADDATQLVFLVVWRKLSTLKEHNSFPSWIYTISRRVISDQRRSAWIRRWFPGVSLESIGDEKGQVERNPETSILNKETGEEVLSILSQLSRKHREVIVLCDLQEYSQAEVAEMLDVKLNTIKSRLKRARDKFLELAEQNGIEVDHG